MFADTRLATYGSLAPDRPNHHQLAGIDGRWLTGIVRGRLVCEGWGAAMGFPALILDASGPAIEVHIFESAELPEHWPRLDAFEGVQYRRVAVEVETPEGRLDTSIYVFGG